MQGLHSPVDRVLFSVVFFFFQAEDGIRDLIVTGVQTCALPISIFRHNLFRNIVAPQGELAGPAVLARSEERRVGEEGRSRGAPDHLKKKKNADGLEGEKNINQGGGSISPMRYTRPERNMQCRRV